jgi:hypothetical protein
MALSILLISSSLARADAQTDDILSLKQQVSKLESRVQKLEKLLDEKFADDRWKDGVLWSRIKNGMSYEDVRKLLGKPARVEEAIFTTWYYHKTSKLHSHVWFDEGKVLGWAGLEQKHRPVRRLKP